MKIDLLSPGDAAWQAVLTSTRHDVYHTPSYVTVDAARVHGSPLALLAQQGETRLLLPLVLLPLARQSDADTDVTDAFSPYGYPAPILSGEGSEVFLNEAFSAFKSKLASLGVSGLFVRMHPLLPAWPACLAQHGSYVLHGETVWIDLTQDDEEIWRQTRPQTRNAITRLTNQGVTVERDEGFEHYPRFMDLYYRTMDHNAASSWYYFDREYFTGLRTVLGERLGLWVAKDPAGAVIAAALFTEEDGIVQYHLACTDREQPYREAMKPLLHHVRVWAKSRGNRALHLGGGVGAGQDPLFLFKSGFSRQRGRFASWRAVCDEKRYAEAVSQWQRQTGRTVESVSGFFPPYRQVS